MRDDSRSIHPNKNDCALRCDIHIIETLDRR